MDDVDLQRVIATWDILPEAIRVAVTALIGTVAPRPEGASTLPQRGRIDLNETARRLAGECRRVVQGCLREEEWQDVDQEFFDIIARGLTGKELKSTTRGNMRRTLSDRGEQTYSQTARQERHICPKSVLPANNVVTSSREMRLVDVILGIEAISHTAG